MHSYITSQYSQDHEGFNRYYNLFLKQVAFKDHLATVTAQIRLRGGRGHGWIRLRHTPLDLDSFVAGLISWLIETYNY